MEAIKSEFQFEQFIIIKSELTFIAPKDANSGSENYIKNITDDYNIEIDFAFQDNGDYVNLFMKVAVNQGKKTLDGYEIFSEGVGVIRKGLPAEKFNELLHSSGLSMALNQLRAYIVMLTSYSPFGKYVLPAIDLVHLIESKNRVVSVQSNKAKSISNSAKKK